MSCLSWALQLPMAHHSSVSLSASCWVDLQSGEECLKSVLQRQFKARLCKHWHSRFSRRCDVISKLINGICDVGGYVGHYAGHDAPKVVTVSQTVPQSFSTEKIIKPTIKVRLIIAYASENAIMFAPPSDQSRYSRVSSSPKYNRRF